MTERDFERRKEDLLARRARLSTAKQATLEKRLQGATMPPIPPVARDKPLPLSLAQQRLWFLDQLEPGNAAYNIPLAVRLKGPLDVAALERSLNDVIRRHETLRTIFSLSDDQPCQVIAPTLTLELPVLDRQDEPEAERERQVQAWVRAEAATPFDLACGPLVRAGLMRLQPEDHVLLVTLHHIISDGWSTGVLVREVAALYQARQTGQFAALANLPLQYADYAAWQRGWLTGEVLASQLNYWTEQLRAPLPLLALPTDHPRPAQQTFRGATQTFTLSREMTEALKSLSRQTGTTLFMTLLAGFQALLQRYSGQTDVIVGTPIANRTRAEVEGLIGFFVNTLALRVNLSGDPTFSELLGRVREVTLEAYAHQDLPFDRLVEELHLPRDLSRTPVFQVMFILQNIAPITIDLPDLTMTAVAIESETAKFDLTLGFVETADGLQGACEYNTDLFEAATVARLIQHLEILLAGSVADPGQRLSQLPWLSAAEQQQVLVDWNDTRRAYSSAQCIYHLIEDQVTRTPEAIAVVDGDEHITYHELNRRANQLAHYLRALGVGPESLVGVCLERSISMIVGLLGILKAGGAYVPLDPAYPAERLTFMLQDSRSSVVLTDSRLLERLSPQDFRPVCFDVDGASITQQAARNPDYFVSPQSLAYLIYTSGSTGRPKGVAIQHDNAVAFLNWVRQIFDPTVMSGVLAATSISFDLSIFEIFGTLMSGGAVVLAQNALQLPELPAASRLTLINTVPSAMKELLPSGNIPESVRVINLAGEPLSQELVEHLYRQPTLERVHDLYGPSETTTYSTQTLRVAGGPATIGRPIDNTQVYILDAHLRPVPIGVSGELYIGGAGVTRGYYQRPDLTAARYMPDPFSRSHGGRLYRTGDLARYRPDGTLELLGRIDQQVKVRGFRIELGEIETSLRQYPAVRDAVVVVQNDQAGSSRLVAYLVRHSSEIEVSALRQYLYHKLPDYMMPAVFVVLEALPLTPNGKVDRRALPAPEQIKLDSQTPLIAPRDAVELRLVQIWEDLLRVQPIGVRHNFFELGGHSLLAVQLIARIRQEWGHHLPVTTLFQGATIEQLAVVLRQTIQPQAISPLVLLQNGPSDQLPVFLVHPGGGHVLGYADLVRHLGPDRPCYALQARGLNDGQEPETSIETMAQHYVAALRTVQPQGPYLLLGWSLGGVIAFEMARQLHAQGQTIARLILLDSYAPAEVTEDEDEPALLAAFAQDLGIAWRSVAFDRECLNGLDPDARLAYLHTQALQAELIPVGVELAQLRQLFHVFQSNVEALRQFRPQVYPGRLIFLKANDAPGNPPATPEADWRKLALGGLELHSVPGNHYTMLREPQVQVLAAQLHEQFTLIGSDR